MAILNDLAKETSFRRFYLRWLAACWLPAVVVLLLWILVAWPFGWSLFGILKIITPLEAWAMIGFGQWLWMRRYSPYAGRWAFLVAAGGVVGTIAWLLLSSHSMSKQAGLIAIPAIVLSPTYGWRSLAARVAAEAMGGAAFGLVLSLAHLWLLASEKWMRIAWAAACAAFGGIAFLLTILAQDPLSHLQRTLVVFQMRELLLYLSVAVVNAPTILLIGWLLFSALLGAALWVFSRADRRAETNKLSRVFD